jgi:hypothetical protein
MIYLIIGWLLCSIAALFVFLHIWRKKFDVTITDLGLFTSMSILGPVALFVAIITWLFEYGDNVIVMKKKS